jgi:hypothetical protein
MSGLRGKSFSKNSHGIRLKKRPLGGGKKPSNKKLRKLEEDDFEEDDDDEDENVNEDEDPFIAAENREIRRLEKLLGLNKKSKLLVLIETLFFHLSCQCL